MKFVVTMEARRNEDVTVEASDPAEAIRKARQSCLVLKSVMCVPTSLSRMEPDPDEEPDEGNPEPLREAEAWEIHAFCETCSAPILLPCNGEPEPYGTDSEGVYFCAKCWPEVKAELEREPEAAP